VAEDRAATYSTRSKFSETQAISEEEQLRAHVAEVTTLGNDLIMRKFDSAIAAEAYDWNDCIDIGSGMAVTLVAARHWSARNLSDRNMPLWASFVIDTPGGRIYFVADSGYGDGRHFRSARKRHGPFKLAVLPIGAYEPRWFMRDHHMNQRRRCRH
jgi:L-ascorbate metabolism protein UlaG (beta-lactamase superfamily)